MHPGAALTPESATELEAELADEEAEDDDQAAETVTT